MIVQKGGNETKQGKMKASLLTIKPYSRSKSVK